jgi:hypothetical protein
MDPANIGVAIGIEHVALAYALGDEFECAARLEGYARRAMEPIGFVREYTEIGTYGRLMSLLSARFSEAELDTLLAEGAALSEEQAFAEALRP